MDIAIYQRNSRGEVRVASPRSAIYELGAYTSLEKGEGVVPLRPTAFTHGKSMRRRGATGRSPLQGSAFYVHAGDRGTGVLLWSPTKAEGHLRLSPTLTTMINPGRES